MKYLSFLFSGLFDIFFNIEKWIVKSMASVKYTAFVDIIQGKVNGTVFSKGVYGAYVRSRGKVIDVFSNTQILVRERFGSLAKLWRELSDSQRQMWDYLGKQITFSNRLGDSLKYTGFNTFMKLNGNLAVCDIAPNNDCPSLASALMPVSLSLEVDCTPGSEDISLNFAPVIAAGSHLIVYATGVLSHGIKNPNKNNFKFIEALTVGQLTGVSIKSAYVAVFGTTPSLGDKIYIMAKYIDNNTGFTSLPLQASAIGSL